jgi:hypothetical protein
VPDKRPLPVGSGGGASFWRADLVGGVGALECKGVPEFVEFDFVMGIDVCLVGSVSISMGVGPEDAAGYDWE